MGSSRGKSSCPTFTPQRGAALLPSLQSPGLWSCRNEKPSQPLVGELGRSFRTLPPPESPRRHPVREDLGPRGSSPTTLREIAPSEELSGRVLALPGDGHRWWRRDRCQSSGAGASSRHPVALSLARPVPIGLYFPSLLCARSFAHKTITSASRTASLRPGPCTHRSRKISLPVKQKLCQTVFLSLRRSK